jgi:hypothetical protein
MPIYHRCAQYSDEYDRLKLGLPTSSNFKKIITPGGDPSKQWRGYACHLIAERLLERKVDTYTSPAMERGLAVEEEATQWYSWSEGRETETIGFITNDEKTMGCTPDRLVGDDGLLEVKCPMPPGQVDYLITGKPHTEHKPQLQGQLYISKREWVDICCWHQELPRIVVRAERDEHFIDKLTTEIEKFNDFIEGVMAKIGSVTAAPKVELKEMLRRSLEET